MADNQRNGGREAEKEAGRISTWVRSDAFRCALILAAGFVCFFLLYCTVCAPQQYDLSVGSIAHVTIKATKDVVDEVTTEERRQAAANAVEPAYRFEEGVKEEVLRSLDTVFGELRTVQQYAATLQSEDRPAGSSYTETEILYAMELVTSITLTRYQVGTLLRTDAERFEEMVSLVTTAVENSLNTTIREGQVSQSIQTILQIVGYKLDVSLTQNIVPAVLRACIKPNMVIEQEATEIARQAARNSVEPTVYLQGQNIVRQGERVTRSQLEVLRSLGLLKNNAYDFSSYLGALLIVTLAMVSLILSLRLISPHALQDPRSVAVIMIVNLLGLGISVLCHLYFSAYMVPAVFGPLLVTVLINAHTGYAVIIPYAILISCLAAGNNNSYLFEMILLQLISLSGSVLSIRIMKGHPQRIRVLLAGLVSALDSVAVIYAMSLMTSLDSMNPTETILWGMGGGLLSGVLTIGLQPLLEAIFRLATPSKLLELSNPNQPLLRRLLLEAPGTYHHSLIVANLSEAAAQRIGANPYLARAAGFYHDIGKLKRPLYFKENQMGENLHDKLDPYVSSAILTSHTRDGYQLALKEGLPREICNIILQHHGDAPVMYFYHKALQLSNGTPVDIREFRYMGPRPDTREAAVVMLADTIEAAVRSMKEPTPKAIDQFIERLVRGKLEDGQLSDSPITLRDIDEICDAFSNVLMGVFHERIEYPEVRHHVPAARPAAAPAGEQSGSAPNPVKPEGEDSAEDGAAQAAAPAQEANGTAEAKADEQAAPPKGEGTEVEKK